MKETPMWEAAVRTTKEDPRDVDLGTRGRGGRRLKDLGLPSFGALLHKPSSIPGGLPHSQICLQNRVPFLFPLFSLFDFCSGICLGKLHTLGSLRQILKGFLKDQYDEHVFPNHLRFHAFFSQLSGFKGQESSCSALFLTMTWESVGALKGNLRKALGDPDYELSDHSNAQRLWGKASTLDC